jgi:hypothetical protein
VASNTIVVDAAGSLAETNVVISDAKTAASSGRSICATYEPLGSSAHADRLRPRLIARIAAWLVIAHYPA